MSGNILFTDYYELTVGRLNLSAKKNPAVTQSYFYRKCPYSRYILAVGVHKFIDFVQELNEGTLMEEHIDWLRRTSGGDMSEDFLDYLAKFQFKGSITGVPVGTPMFPNEPIVNVTGSLIDVQILETYLLHAMNTMSPVATEASRLRVVAGKRSVTDFGARRSYNPMWTAEAAYIGGVDATSLVKAGRELGIPYFGTMSHAYIQSRWDGKISFSDSELLAFREYAKTFPHNTVLLVDTYNTINGTLNAIIIARELRANGYELKGIRLDSGDLVELSKTCRSILDQAGFNGARIYLSDGINALKAKKMLDAGARADGFGCGTYLVHPPALGGVFKIVQCGDNSYMKFTDNPEKMTLPGRRQVYRHYDVRGQAAHDLQALWEEKIDSTKYVPLHKYLWKGSEPCYEFPSVKEMREYVLSQMKTIKPSIKQIFDPSSGSKPPMYIVDLSPELEKIRNVLIGKYKKEFGETKKDGEGWKERMKEIFESHERIMTWDMGSVDR